MKEIEKIIQTYHNTNWEKEKVALGTVVKVDGSAYRRIGARMYVSNTGHWVGGISGGCLEGDALKRAQIAIMKNESSIVVYDTTEEDPHQIGVGLGCKGRIEVLFTPIDHNDKNNQIEFLKTIIHQRQPCILLQILNTHQKEKVARGAFYTMDQMADLAKASQVPLSFFQERMDIIYQQKKSKVFHWTSDKQERFEILFEWIRPKIKLICVGDNYDINAFMGIATELGWEIHVAGKPRKLSKIVYQAAKKTYSLQEAEQVQVDNHTAIILMSHDYKTDIHLLKHYLKLDIPYIGLLGPKKRMQRMQEDFDEAGLAINLASQANIFAPVGLDIGAESPEEIALSIAAEIIAVFRKRKGGYLRNRVGSIYERE